MLLTVSTFKGAEIAAQDDNLGAIVEFLFDDDTWRVRWLVVETGSWLFGRKVLLPVTALGHFDPDNRRFSVKLTRKQVEDSPDVNTQKPVSRQMESSLFDYYGWSPYWGNGYSMSGYGYGYANAMATPPYIEHGAGDVEHAEQSRDAGDPHLRSAAEVTGYHILARDGEIGHVEDFLVEETDWTIHFLIVDTRNWWPGKRVLVSPRSVREVDWVEQKVHLGVYRQWVKDSPEYDPNATVDREFEDRVHRHYSESAASEGPDPGVHTQRGLDGGRHPSL